MAGKSVEQRISDTETRIRQLETQKRLLAEQLKQQARKERTRRLIQIGAIMVRLGVDTLANAQALQAQVEDNPEVRAWLDQVITLGGGPSQGVTDGEISSSTNSGEPNQT